MKNVKNDTKYIIKRILIGVGIAIILFNLKKCNAYALTYESYVQSANNYNSGFDFYSRKWTETQCNNLNYSKMRYSTFTYNDIEYSFCYSSVRSDVKYNTPFIISFLYNDDIYISYGDYNPQNLSYLNMNLTNSNLYYTNINTNDILPPLQTYSSVNRAMIKLTGATITRTNVQRLLPSTLYENNNYENLRVIYNSTPYQLTINQNYSVPDVPTDPLADYTQLDLTSYEGVLLVPKDYQTMQENFSRTEQPVPGTFITYLDLDFYSQNCIRSTLINLTNVNDLMTNNIGTNIGGLAGSISGTCTEEPFQTILSYRYDMLSGMIPMGIMIYNNEIITGTYNNGFGTSYVWYNPTYYDYYLIESLADFNSDIKFIDYDGTEKTLNVENIPDFQEMAKIAIETEEGDLNKQQINSLLNYTKIPIPFLQNLRNYQCDAIRMPFPWSSSIMIMPCMSTLYNNVIPSAMIGVISIIINGLLIYRGIMSIVGTFIDLSRPDSTKLEVLDL